MLFMYRQNPLSGNAAISTPVGAYEWITIHRVEPVGLSVIVYVFSFKISLN